MKRTAEWALVLLAAILAASFMAALAGWGSASIGDGSRASRDGRYFHAGKTPAASAGNAGCGASGCHAGMPHARDRAQAAFRNMHVRFVECLVCHGGASRTSWTVEPPTPGPAADGGTARKRWKLATPGGTVDREKPHAALGASLSCRKCHSEEGRQEFAAKGVKDLPSGFVNPVALRMMEEGAKQWIPDSMR